MAVKEQTPQKAKPDNRRKEGKVSQKSKPGMKAGPPKKKAQQKADQVARMAIASGDVMKDEVERKTEQDARTLYIRFGEKQQPKNAEEIKELHSDIKFVRTPRTSSKAKAGIGYAFIEFGDLEECKAAKNKLATTQFKGDELFLDFVGENSKAKKKTAKASCQLNPTRLFVCGLAQGVNKSNLQEMFPKAGSACIPQRSKKKGTSYGFVQFSTPADAKAAFDAAQDLTIANHKITVLFAKMTDTKPEVQKKKAEKRKAKTEEKKLKKAKTDDDVKETVEETEEEKGIKKATKREKMKAKKEVKKETEVKEEKATEVKKSEEDDDVEDDEEEEDLDDTVAEKAEEDEEDDDDDDDEEDGSEGEENVEGADEDDDDDDEDDE